MDTASNTYHAVNGSTAFSTDANQATPNGYSGWYFNGSSSIVSGPANSIYPPGITVPSSFTVDMWVNVNEPGRPIYFTSKHNGSVFTYNFIRKLDKRLTLSVTFPNGENFECNGVNILTEGKWHFMTTAVKGDETGSELHIYLDGGQDCLQMADKPDW
jgi:hypothetical protein